MSLNLLRTHCGLSHVLYEAHGDSGRRYVASCGGQAWTLDLYIDSEYEAAHEVEPQPAGSSKAALRMAQQWETEAY